jgi:hypothetical protein
MKRVGPTIQLSTEAARRLIDEINRGAANVRSLLLQLHDGEGWRALGYKTWDACIESEFVFSRRHANRQLIAAQIDERVRPVGGTHGSHFLLPERHARELAVVPEGKQIEVYRRALETSPNGLTAEHIRQTIAAMGFRRCATVFDDGADGPTMRRHRSNQSHETPWELISAIEKRFGLIELDLAATAKNKKAGRHISKQQDSLKCNWAKMLNGGLGYLNPEFDPVTPWIEKSIEQKLEGARFVDLLQGSMDANWFWKMLRHCQVYALEPRVTFLGEKDVFPKPLVLSAFNCQHNNEPGKTIERIPGKFHGLYRWHWTFDVN